MSPKLSGRGGWNTIWVGGGGKLKKNRGEGLFGTREHWM